MGDRAHGEAEVGPIDLGVWAVSTLNVVTFGLLLVLVGHSFGLLADVLPEIGTLPGIAGFVYLWALVVAATAAALPDEGLDGIRTRGVTSFLVDGVVAGTVTGAGFVLGVVVVAGLPLVILEGVDPVGLALVGVLGTGFGGIAGGVVGSLFAALDLVLFRAADALVPET